VADPVHGSEAAPWGGWHWKEPRNGEHFRRCSYCGSVHPGDLVAEPSWKASWADQKYGWPHKFYVDIPNRQPERLFIISGHRDNPNAGEYAPGGSLYRPIQERMPGIDWVPVGELPADVCTDGWLREGESLADRYDLLGLDTKANHFGKFYSVHLADPEISGEVKETIQQHSGIGFHFADGTVRWTPVAETIPG
jgi:hypothetical protein